MMINCKRAFALAAVLVLAVPAAAAQAQVVIDQSALVQPGGNSMLVAPIRFETQNTGVRAIRGAVQTFTAGTAGILDHLDFQAAWSLIPITGSYRMSLYDGDYASGTAKPVYFDGAPLVTLPGSGDIRNGAVARFDVRTAGYAVTVGQRYSVVFEADPYETTEYRLIIGYAVGTPPTFFGSGYAGGALHYMYNGVVQPASAYDVGFVSWVDTSASAVPEPASWALMLLGAGAAGGAMRRRRRGVARFARA